MLKNKLAVKRLNIMDYRKGYIPLKRQEEMKDKRDIVPDAIHKAAILGEERKFVKYDKSDPIVSKRAQTIDKYRSMMQTFVPDDHHTFF